MSLAERLLAIDSCAVSDALDKLGLPPAVSGLRPLTVNRKLAGPVVTVRLGPDPPEGVSKQHLGTAAIDIAGPGDLIVIDNAGRQDCAAWGGVLSMGAGLAAVSGVIVDGAARDIDDAIELGFPIYAAESTPVTARGRVYEQESNGPIRIRSVPVNPGDYAIADANGIAFIPEQRAAEIVEVAERICRRERLMVQELHQGRKISDVLGLDYEDMLNRQR